MKWEKKGKIELETFRGSNSYVRTFAMTPTPIIMDENTIRIYIGFCDENNVGRISFIDVDASNPCIVKDISKLPVLDIGRPGSFDDNGVVPISVWREQDKIFLYYVGFQLGTKIPYFMFGGLAISRDGGNSFERYSETPILDRCNNELFARCGMYVLKDNNIFKMWYIGTEGEGWTKNRGTLKPLYTMRYLESEDGLHWGKPSVQCLTFHNSDEHGFGRPYVWKENGRYKMLYSIRTYSRGYYIGYAEADDGINWIRCDNLAGITTSDTGWDNENISYPVVIKAAGKTYMFYNGNGCGRTGFGYAELVEE